MVIGITICAVEGHPYKAKIGKAIYLQIRIMLAKLSIIPPPRVRVTDFCTYLNSNIPKSR
jgi:hypothetical protein